MKGISHMQANSLHKLNFDPHGDNIWAWPIIKLTTWIVHIFIIVHYQVAIFQRTGSGIWGPISETWEPIDLAQTREASFIRTAMRGPYEEANLEIPPDKIMPTGFQFQTVSTNKKPIKGQTFFAQVGQGDIDNIKLNPAELSDYRMVHIHDALNLMDHPEAVEGLLSVSKIIMPN
jgi:hypothetical protein